jgi:DNA polymerase elongation subunit (family B)
MLGGEVITRDDLIVSKLMGQDITKYKSLFPHVSAAIQLSYEDKHPSKGDTIKYNTLTVPRSPLGIDRIAA